MSLPKTAIVAALGLAVAAAACRSAELDGPLRTLRAVGPRGAGNGPARDAWQQAARAEPAQLPELLAALDGANPLAANWIRTAIDAVCERAIRSEGGLPEGELERFVLETSHDPKARRLAYEWLLEVDPQARDRLVAHFLSDPSPELRREAVEQVVAQADAAEAAGNQAEAGRLLQTAFDAARDRDQVGALATRLEKRGAAVDLVRHDGLLVDWLVLGPFDNTGEAGFDRVYPPEEDSDPQRKYQGKHGPVGWRAFASDHADGKVDLNAALADSMAVKEEREVVAYAAAEFHAPESRTVQIRSASSNAIKIWLNGRLVDQHNVYHSGSTFDQYRAEATLQAGRNLVLVKLCQNAQTQPWATVFSFHLRICDRIGTGILSQDPEGGKAEQP